MKKKDVTIDTLAQMVKEGFDQMATKNELGELKIELQGVQIRLDRIENLLLRDHLNRIEHLEDDMRAMKTKTGVR